MELQVVMDAKVFSEDQFARTMSTHADSVETALLTKTREISADTAD